MTVKPLQGLRVSDFTHAFAGPTGTLMLALMGAEVIKIESSAHSDVATRDPKHAKGMEPVGVFFSTNLNKLSIQLNLKHKEAINLAKRLIAISDIVVENYRPGVMDKLGLGYEMLKEVKPDIIMVSLSSNGSTGPERSYGAYAAVMGPLSGLSHITGYPDGPPVPIRSTADTLAGITSMVPLLAALNYRQRTGKGQHIDSSAVESLTICMSDVLMDYSMNKRVRGRNANRDDVMAPHNCYRCKGEDKWISIAISNNEEWTAFCKAARHPEWAEDLRFSDGPARWENQEILDRLIEGWTGTRTNYQVMKVLQKAGVAAVPSFTNQEIVTDPHLQARGIFQKVDQPFVGVQTQMGLPWKAITPAEPVRPVPLLGQHNEYVFGTLLGMTRQEIERLQRGEIII